MKKLMALMTAAAVVFVLVACSSDTERDPIAASPNPTATPSSASGDEASPPDSDTEEPSSTTRFTIIAGDQTFEATLNDTKVALDFAKMLPITLPWFRNSGIEYITELDAPMTETGPFYTDVQPGDIVYYNPLDSITIIYEETSSVPTLTKMGEVTSDLSTFRDLPDNIDMRIEETTS